jgi:cobalt-zinc-cadmium efflux system outer membrane protein
VTLDRALELALARRPAVQAAASRVLAAEAASRQARAWRNPEAVVDMEGFGGDRTGFDEAEVTLGVAGGIDLFGRARAEGSAADAALGAQRARRLSTEREVGAQTRRIFHEILAAREQLRNAALVVDVARNTTDAIRREIDAGKTATLRGIQSEAALETALVHHGSARDRLERANTRLSRWLGETAAHPRPVVAVGGLRDALPPLDTEALVEELVAGHPEIESGLWAAETHGRRGRRLSRERWPELGFSIGYRHSRATDLSDWVGGLSIELPLLDRKGGGVEEAQKLAAAARDETRETALYLAGELEQAVQACRSARSFLDRYDADVLPRAHRALDLVRLGYDEGKFGYLDLMDAQRALALSQAERGQALIDLDRSITDLEILLGRTLDYAPDSPED